MKLLDTISGALSKFVLAWALPSTVAVGLFGLFVLPEVDGAFPFRQVVRAATPGAFSLGIVLAFFVVTLSTVFAYCSLPVYRLLEGYTLPRNLRLRLRAGQIREFRTLERLQARSDIDLIGQQLNLERRMFFPDDEADIQATRLGNGLRALETYGYDRYRLDSQTLWYDLMSVSPEAVRADVEQTRASVDLFVSFVAHFVLLGLVSVVVAIVAASWECLVLAVVVLALARPAYTSAVRNTLEWRHAVQAMVNTGRVPLAERTGFDLPGSHDAEREMWGGFSSFVAWRDHDGMRSINRFRTPRTGPSTRAGTGR